MAATALLLGALATLPACASAPLAPLEPRALPGWARDAHDGLRPALQQQCASPRPPTPWPRLCSEFQSLNGPIGAWVERRFVATPLAADDGNPVGLITGYYEPLLTGSRERTSPSQVPLYRRPPAPLLAGSPTRARIEREGLLAGQELLWVDDPVDAFFLQVQGSGRVRLRDGTTVRVGFAGDNGHPYRSIGRELIDRGAIAPANVTADAIKDWLRANPADAPRVMQSNPRYVFFRELEGTPADAGPPGSLGVPLTPGRSVAVDPKRVPPGALMWLSTTHPRSGAPLRRMVLAQDTGAAIVGAVRADLFWGSGADAGIDAGRMRQAGRLWLLRPAD